MSKIDPTLLGSSSLAYSTYFGGGNPTTGTTIGGGIAVDQNNNVYITGGTNFLHVGNADDFPILNGYQSCLNVPPPSSTTTPPPLALLTRSSPNSATPVPAQPPLQTSRWFTSLTSVDQELMSALESP